MSGEKETALFGSPDAEYLLVQPVDDHDLTEMKPETDSLKKLTEKSWCILTVRISDWMRELTPWKNPPVFGKEGFGDGAGETLTFIMDHAIPEFEKEHPIKTEFSGRKRKYYLGGYSLAGFFSLWAAYQTDFFSGIAAVSPSVWYPGWAEYAKERRPLASNVYLSLGDREEKTRNKVMASVGDAIRKQNSLLKEQGIRCTLEWNRGNHFADNGIRMARGFAWLLEQDPDSDQEPDPGAASVPAEYMP